MDKILEVDWLVREEQSFVDERGSFTHQIKWVPPKGSSGYIVQYVSVDDPLCLIKESYDKPYYEAWRVENGIVIYDFNTDTYYDDSFSNCYDGLLKGDIAENNLKKMKAHNVVRTHIAYNCMVYWTDVNTTAAKEIDSWKRGIEIDICMAGKLKASYEKPSGLGEGKERIFRADFIADRNVI